MSNGLFSGVPGLSLGVGLYRGVSSLWSGASGLITGWGGSPPSTGFTVISGDGSSYTVPLTVLAADGTSYTVPTTVLSADGTSYSPI